MKKIKLENCLYVTEKSYAKLERVRKELGFSFECQIGAIVEVRLGDFDVDKFIQLCKMFDLICLDEM